LHGWINDQLNLESKFSDGFLCIRHSKVEAGAGLDVTQNPLPPSPSKRATSLDFHGEGCGILAYKSNTGKASTLERQRHIIPITG
jgi:hypothetical protein